MVKLLTGNFIIHLFLLLVFVALGMILLAQVSISSKVAEFLQDSQRWFELWRYSFFILFIIFWRPIIICWSRRQHLPKRTIVSLLHLRYWFVIFFVLFELLISYDLAGKMIRFF